MAPAVNGSAPHDDLATRVDLLAAEAGYGGMRQASLLLSTMAELLREVARTEAQEPPPTQEVRRNYDPEASSYL